MNIIARLGCRAFQLVFRAALPILPYRTPELIYSVNDVAGVLSSEGRSVPLVVTDGGILRAGIADSLFAALTEGGIKYAVFSDVHPNPTVENVEAALAVYNARGCDSIVAIGGGSAMDCAKALGARVAYPKRSLAKMGGILRVLRGLPTLIAIPTTAGTGSETTLAAVITDEKTHHKYALMSFPLIPHYAVLDASLTYSLPRSLTATTGMDALTHAVEAYIGRSSTRETRRFAIEATRLVFSSIESAYNDGTDREARENMLRAAYLAGAAFSKSYVGYIHAVAHSLGGRYGTPHGLANAVIMPYFLEAYGASVHKKLHTLGIAAGVASESDTHAVGADKFIKAIIGLNRRMGIPEKLSGIVKDDIPALARHAAHEANPLYPVPVLMTARELERFYIEIADSVK